VGVPERNGNEFREPQENFQHDKVEERLGFALRQYEVEEELRPPVLRPKASSDQSDKANQGKSVAASNQRRYQRKYHQFLNLRWRSTRHQSLRTEDVRFAPKADIHSTLIQTNSLTVDGLQPAYWPAGTICNSWLPWAGSLSLLVWRMVPELLT
jgi:hypothetical protein